MDQGQGTHEGTGTGWRIESTGECSMCGVDVAADTEDGGLNCARCGQWHVLCGECMPAVPEFSRDAIWVCPECRQ